MAKAKKGSKAKVLVDCNLCRSATELASGEKICTLKYQGEDVVNYSKLSDDLIECIFYKEKK